MSIWPPVFWSIKGGSRLEPSNHSWSLPMWVFLFPTVCPLSVPHTKAFSSLCFMYVHPHSQALTPFEARKPNKCQVINAICVCSANNPGNGKQARAGPAILLVIFINVQFSHLLPPPLFGHLSLSAHPKHKSLCRCLLLPHQRHHSQQEHRKYTFLSGLLHPQIIR